MNLINSMRNVADVIWDRFAVFSLNSPETIGFQDLLPETKVEGGEHASDGRKLDEHVIQVVGLT